MQPPGPGDLAVAGADRGEVLGDEEPVAERRPQHHPAEKRVVPPQYLPQHPRQPAPDRGIDEIRLRVVIGVGQRRVMMVLQVGVAEPPVGNGERQPGKDQRLVHQRVVEGMAVQRLVLQRGELRDGKPGQQQATALPTPARSACPPPRRDRWRQEGSVWAIRSGVASCGTPLGSGYSRSTTGSAARIGGRRRRMAGMPRRQAARDGLRMILRQRRSGSSSRRRGPGAQIAVRLSRGLQP